MTTVWFDKVKTCVGWDMVDQAQIAELRRCLDSELTEVIKVLASHLAQFKNTEPLMSNARFVRRLHSVLREWLIGLLDGTFDEEYAQARRAFVQELVEVDLAFEDIILLESLTRKRLLELAQKQLDGDPQALSAKMHTLNKALCLDLALIHSGYLQIRDAEMEHALLDRFLAITGFSRTLYENLAEAREWSELSLPPVRSS